MDPQTVEYVNTVKRLVESCWVKNLDAVDPETRLTKPAFTTTVEVSLDASGGLEKCSVVEASGADALDEAVVAAFRSGVPFPPAPKSLGGRMGWCGCRG